MLNCYEFIKINRTILETKINTLIEINFKNIPRMFINNWECFNQMSKHKFHQQCPYNVVINYYT